MSETIKAQEKEQCLLLALSVSMCVPVTVVFLFALPFMAVFIIFTDKQLKCYTMVSNIKPVMALVLHEGFNLKLLFLSFTHQKLSNMILFVVQGTNSQTAYRVQVFKAIKTTTVIIHSKIIIKLSSL